MTGMVVGPPPNSHGIEVDDAGDNFGMALRTFIWVLGAIARARAGDDARVIERWTFRLVARAQGLAVAPMNAAELGASDQRELLVHMAEELWFFNWSYRTVDDTTMKLVVESIPPDVRHLVDGVPRDPGAMGAVQDAEVIIGSIEKLIDRLPRVLQKFLHALLEVLKLTRGGG
jgi:hypothetical protein